MADENKKEKDDKKAPIIVKKIKKGGHGHHGGAWKVAYADFVTAMMAFFLLLWLLSSAPQETLKGISDYFQPTVGLKDAKGIGFDGGTSADDDKDIQKAKAAPPVAVVFGSPRSGPVVEDTDHDVKDEEAEQQKLIKVEDQIKDNISNSEKLREYKDQIQVDMTPEGLRIQIVDTSKRPMFKDGTAVMEEHFKVILAGVTEFIKSVPNYISITGHTDASASGNKNYGNFELSADRANVSRRFMEDHGFHQERVAWIIGKADREPMMPQEPLDPHNRRISIILLKRTVLPKHLQTTPEKLFLQNRSDGDDTELKLDGAE